MQDAIHFVFVLGCTGCGKGALGRRLAGVLGGEIISVDSMKLYRRMDIGTAKPSAEIRARIPHHLIDVADPWEDCSAAWYVVQAEAAAEEITRRGRIVLAVGGTALYIKALSEGMFEGPGADPVLRAEMEERARMKGVDVLHAELAAIDPGAAQRIHRNDLRRVIRALEVHQLTGITITALQSQWDRERTRHPCTFIGLRRSLEDQNRRTNLRVKNSIDRGWVEEVRSLLADPRGLSTSARQALGYHELIDYVQGKVSLEDAVESIKISTRRLAKSQRTWFKRFRATQWYDVGPDETADHLADRILSQWTHPISMKRS